MTNRTVEKAQNSLLKLSASASSALANCCGQVKKVSKFLYIKQEFQQKKEELLSNPTPSAFKTPPPLKCKSILAGQKQVAPPISSHPAKNSKYTQKDALEILGPLDRSIQIQLIPQWVEQCLVPVEVDTMYRFLKRKEKSWQSNFAPAVGLHWSAKTDIAILHE